MLGSERWRRIREGVRMGWKRALSYRKRDWELEDYPVTVRAQELDPAWERPGLTQHKYVARITGWFVDATGDTKVEALGRLQDKLARRKAELREKGEPLPRPGTHVPIEFAATDRIEAHGEVVNDLLERVFGIKGAWVSDESSLGDFTLTADNDEVCAQIREEFGVDVSDIPNGNLAEIVERIAKSREQGN